MPEALREKEIARLQKEITKLDAERQAVRKKLDNEKFISKAPKEIVERERERLDRVQTELGKIRNQLSELSG